MTTRLFHTFSDGGARGNPGPAAIGALICDDKNQVLEEATRLIGETTNNVAEYNAMLLALELAKKRHARRLVCYADSQLLIFQLQGTYRIKDLKLKPLAEKVKSLAAGFDQIEYRQVPREHPMITRADKILNQTLNRAQRSAPPALQPPHRSGPAQGELF